MKLLSIVMMIVFGKVYVFCVLVMLIIVSSMCDGSMGISCLISDSLVR